MINRFSRCLDNRMCLDDCVETEIVFGDDPEEKVKNPVVKIYSGAHDYVAKKIEGDSKRETTGAYATLVITNGERAGYALITVPYSSNVDDIVRYIQLAERKILEQNHFETEEVNRTLRVMFRDKDITTNKAKYVTQEDKLDVFKDRAKVEVGYE